MNKIILLIISLLFFVGTNLQAQNQVLPKHMPDLPTHLEKDNYLKDSAYFSLGNTFGESWFRYKINRVHTRNEAGNLLSASDYEYDTLSLNWFEQRRYEGTFTLPNIQKSWQSSVFDKSNSQWKLTDSIIFNTFGSPTRGWYKIWDPNAEDFISGKLTDYFYNDQGVLHLNYNQQWDTVSDSWKNDYYEVYYYTQQGLDSLKQIFNWNTQTEDWADSLRISYSYSDKQLPKAEIYQKWIAGTWLNFKKWSFTFDAQNLLTEEMEYYWDEFSGNWEDKDKSTLEYFENQNLKRITDYLWDGSEWLNKTRKSYAYNSQGLPEETLNEYWSFGFDIWTYSSRNNFGYDANGNRTLFTFYLWNELSEEWRNFYQEESFWTFFESQLIKETKSIDFEIFPNPATDYIWINPGKEIINSGKLSLRIYGQDGRLISARTLPETNTKIDVSQFSAGTYILVLSTDQGSGSKIFTVK